VVDFVMLLGIFVMVPAFLRIQLIAKQLDKVIWIGLQYRMQAMHIEDTVRARRSVTI